jgi:hypothetical protein
MVLSLCAKDELSMSKQRPLTEKEATVIRTIREYESQVDKHALTIDAYVTEDEMFNIYELEFGGIVKTLQVSDVKLEDGSRMFQVIFRTPEFEKYLHFALNRQGMAMLISGKIKLNDGFIFET